jgi:hypothetical protein
MQRLKIKRCRFSFWVGVFCSLAALATLVAGFLEIVPLGLFKFEIPLLLALGGICMILGSRPCKNKEDSTAA